MTNMCDIFISTHKRHLVQKVTPKVTARTLRSPAHQANPAAVPWGSRPHPHGAPRVPLAPVRSEEARAARRVLERAGTAMHTGARGPRPHLAGAAATWLPSLGAKASGPKRSQNLFQLGTSQTCGRSSGKGLHPGESPACSSVKYSYFICCLL